MKQFFKETDWWVIIPIVLLCLLFTLTIIFIDGCKPVEPQIITKPGSQLLVKIIEKNNWLVTLSILGVGAGFFAFLNGYKYSVQIMGACLVVLSIFIMLTEYAVWVAFLTMGTSVFLMGYTILIKHKALVEIVKGVQDVKKDISKIGPNDKNSVNMILSENQSSETKTVVANIKEKINNVK